MKKFAPVTLLALSTLLGTAQAAVKLPNVNCAGGSNARCQYSSSNDGKVGSGLPFNLGGFVAIRSGFVDANDNAVYVPVEFGGQQDNQGVIMKVDLATGNRTILSGYDGEEFHGKGQDYVDYQGQKASAYDLGRVEVVRPGPDSGSVLALVDKGLQQRTEIFRIDKKTGDRSLVWASKVFNDSAKDGPTSIRTIEQQKAGIGGSNMCKSAGDDRVALKPEETFETDGKNVYLFFANQPSGTGIGLMKVPVSSGKCEWVSQYWPDGTGNVGSGPTVNTLSPLVFSSALVGNEFVGVTGPNPSGNTMFAINVNDGKRRTVSLLNRSTPARSKGSGDAEVGRLGRMAVTSDGLAATMGKDTSDEYFEPTLVKLSTGDRTGTEAKSGSLKNSGRDSNASIVAAIPGTHKFIVAYNRALHVWDTDNGSSYVLSQ